MTPDWARVRGEFPSLAEWTFLNTATFGQLPRRSVEAVARHFAERDATACANFLTWFDDHDRLRAKLARLFNATVEDVAFVPNAATALALLGAGLDWREGDEIITLENEFPNQIYAPAHLGRRGVVVHEAPFARVFDLLNPRTRLVALSTVNYATGFRAPLDELCRECARRGILTFLDGTQSAGALRFDFAATAPDIFAVNAYKWMLAPNGAGFMLIHPRLRERLEPLTIGWRSHHDWRNVDHLHHGAPEFKTSAEKYEGGMLPSSALYALEASVDLMLELTPEAIDARVLALAAGARRRLEALGAEPLPYEDSPVIAAALPGRDASQVARDLKAQRVLVSARHNRLRVSTHFYNNESDLDRLAAALTL
jgi:cysteine desulfurase / selenocysteine lyase